MAVDASLRAILLGNAGREESYSGVDTLHFADADAGSIGILVVHTYHGFLGECWHDVGLVSKRKTGILAVRVHEFETLTIYNASKSCAALLTCQVMSA